MIRKRSVRQQTYCLLPEAISARTDAMRIIVAPYILAAFVRPKTGMSDPVRTAGRLEPST